MTLGPGEVLFTIALYIFLLLRLLSTSLAILVLVLSLTLILWREKRRVTHWQRIGVPGPKAKLFLGNTAEFRQGVHVMDEKWSKLYGDTYGSYVLGRADLASTNPEILREALVKKFHCFPDRARLHMPIHDDETNPGANALTALAGERWKNVRARVSPAFTSNKIKLMIPTFSDCSSICCDVLEEFAEKKEAVDVKEVVGRLTLDMISKSAFGVNYDVQRDANSPFISNARSFFSLKISNPAVIAILLFPNICMRIQHWMGRTWMLPKENAFFSKTLGDLYRRRIELNDEDETGTDFFALLQKSLKEEDRGDEDEEIQHGDHLIKSKRVLTKCDIISQSFLFLLAGYETSSTTLTFLLYVLASLPEIQEKVRKEVREICGEKEEVDFEAVTKMHYVDMVMNEILRMYPPAVRVNRVCVEATDLKGIPMRVDDSFSVPIRMIHYDEKNWPNPLVFDPERFTPEARAARDPLTFLPFGFGPRNCIGMRVAQFQIRTAVAHILRRFRLSTPPGAPTLPLDIDTRGSLKPKEKLFVLFEKL